MSIFSIFSSNGPSGYGYSTTAEQVTEGLDLSGKTILITGSNSGFGNEALRVLTMRGARVLATARTIEKVKTASKGLTGEIIPFACELSEPNAVRACVESIKSTGFKIDAIICYAGIMALPKLTKVHGYEAQFYTNHIGHFILVTGLIEQLTDDGRVIMLSSDAHSLMAPTVGIDFDNLSGVEGYKPFVAYGQSKLANVLFAKELARRFKGTNRVANAVHPGAANTGLVRNMKIPFSKLVEPLMGLFVKTVEQGTSTSLYAAVHPATAKINGVYFANCNTAKYSRLADDEKLCKRLWKVSENIANEK